MKRTSGDARAFDVRAPEGWSAPPVRCDDCDKELDADSLEHGENGFGHYRRCCDCYDRRQRGGSDEYVAMHSERVTIVFRRGALLYGDW